MVAQGDPSTPGNLCFVSPADRTAGEFDLTTTCPGTVRIRVRVSLSFSVRLPPTHVVPCPSTWCVNFGNTGFGSIRIGRLEVRTAVCDVRHLGTNYRPNVRTYINVQPYSCIVRFICEFSSFGFRSVRDFASARSERAFQDRAVVLRVTYVQFHDGPPGTPFWCIARRTKDRYAYAPRPSSIRHGNAM